MPVEGRGPELGTVRKGGRDVATDGSLRGSAVKVRKLQTVLHAKAKEEPDPLCQQGRDTKGEKCLE